MPDISINPNSAFGVGYPQNQNSVNQPLDEQSVAVFEAAMSDTSPATVSSAAPAAIDFKTQVAALSPEQQQMIAAVIKSASNPLPGTLSNVTPAATDVKPLVLSPEQQQQLNEYSNTMKKQLGISQ